MKYLKIALLIFFSFYLCIFINQYINDNYIKESQKFITYEITEKGNIKTLQFSDMNLSFYNTDKDNNKYFINSRNQSAYKLDNNDNLLWTFTLNKGVLHSIIPNNKTYIMVLKEKSLPSIIEADSSGKIIWQSDINYSPEIVKVFKNNNLAFYDKKNKIFIEIDHKNNLKRKIKNTFCNNVLDFKIKEDLNIVFNCRNSLIEIDSKGKIATKTEFTTSTPKHSRFYTYMFNNGNYFILNQQDKELTVFDKSGSILDQMTSSNFKHIVREIPSSNGAYIILCTLVGT